MVDRCWGSAVAIWVRGGGVKWCGVWLYGGSEGGRLGLSLLVEIGEMDGVEVVGV